jgi:hypothetical protein
MLLGGFRRVLEGFWKGSGRLGGRGEMLLGRRSVWAMQAFLGWLSTGWMGIGGCGESVLEDA